MAHPPRAGTPIARLRPGRPYPGPPRYRWIPRWGFRPGPWIPASPRPGTPSALELARTHATSAVPLLWTTALVALVAAGAETWRYVLLLASREGALSAGAVATSDALVTAAGTVAPLVALLAGGLTVAWTVRASAAAAARSGLRPPRSARAVVAGWLVPGINLGMPGAILAEIEHAALDRPSTQRPRPSRRIVVWWALWAAGVVLSAVVLAWSLRESVQARADGVVLHAALNLLAVAVAAGTALLVRYLTRLLDPVRPVGRRLVLAGARGDGVAPGARSSSQAPVPRAGSPNRDFPPGWSFPESEDTRVHRP